MTQPDINGSIEILLIEDNPGDIRLFQEAIKMSTFNLNLSIVQDGEKALDYLNRKPPFTDAAYPDLILLDINLPRKSGLEVLTTLKTHPINRRIPVIILTSSQAPEDIQTAYDNYANCYIVKPVQLSDFFQVISTLEKFWLHQAQLPIRGHHGTKN